MENERYNWNLINKVANQFWQIELSYINDQQISIVQKSIEDNTSLKDNLLEYKHGFKFELKPILENAKIILELIILIVNIVLLYKNTKNDEKLILDIRTGKKSDEIIMKLIDTDDETIKKIIKMIKDYYGIR